jgi:hypothetical protein
MAATKTLASGATDGCDRADPGGRLDGSGYVPCSVQGNKRPRPRQLETGTAQFGTRSTFPLQGAPYSNWLSSELLSVGPCGGHGAAIHAFRLLISTCMINDGSKMDAMQYPFAQSRLTRLTPKMWKRMPRTPVRAHMHSLLGQKNMNLWSWTARSPATQWTQIPC